MVLFTFSMFLLEVNLLICLLSPYILLLSGLLLPSWAFIIFMPTLRRGDKEIIYLLLLFILIEISYIWLSFIIIKYYFLFCFLLFPLYDGTLYSIYWTKVLINQWASKLSWVSFYPNFSCPFFVCILSSFSHGLYISNIVSEPS